jgi:methionyl-tRNA formyltransferase
MRAVIVGAVESTRVTLRALAAAPEWEAAALITLPPELASRHSDFTDMSGEAADAGAHIFHAANSNAPEILEAVAALAPDYVFVIGWSQICKPAFREAAGGKVIGYHPAALPRLRGRAVIPWTILLDEKITASSLFWIDDGVDSGPLLAQRFFHVAPDETAASLYGRHMAALEDMLGETLPMLAGGKAPRLAQDERFATWAAKRTPADGRIDWQRPTMEIERLIRAVGRPYPGAFTETPAGQMTIWAARPWPEAVRHSAVPGQIIARERDSFVVRCGDGGALQVTDFTASSEIAPRLHSLIGNGSKP